MCFWWRFESSILSEIVVFVRAARGQNICAIHMQMTFNWWFLFYGNFSSCSEKDYHSIMCVSAASFRLFCINAICMKCDLRSQGLAHFRNLSL